MSPTPTRSRSGSGSSPNRRGAERRPPSPTRRHVGEHDEDAGIARCGGAFTLDDEGARPQHQDASRRLAPRGPERPLAARPLWNDRSRFRSVGGQEMVRRVGRREDVPEDLRPVLAVHRAAAEMRQAAGFRRAPALIASRRPRAARAPARAAPGRSPAASRRRGRASSGRSARRGSTRRARPRARS